MLTRWQMVDRLGQEINWHSYVGKGYYEKNDMAENSIIIYSTDLLQMMIIYGDPLIP